MLRQPPLTASACSLFARLFLTSLVTILCVAADSAEISKSATLDEVLAIAASPEPPNKDEGYYTERFAALQRLIEWPKGSTADETRIAATFLAALNATGRSIRTAGAWGFGDRGHSDAIPTIIKLGEKEPTLMTSFFERYFKHPVAESSLKSLRPVLLSQNKSAKCETLRAIANSKAVTLRADVEEILVSDSSDDVRDLAAVALGGLGLSESAPAIRRAFNGGLQRGGVAWALAKLGDEGDLTAMLPLLQSKEQEVRRDIARALASAKVVNSKAACDALLASLRDP